MTLIVFRSENWCWKKKKDIGNQLPVDFLTIGHIGTRAAPANTRKQCTEMTCRRNVREGTKIQSFCVTVGHSTDRRRQLVRELIHRWAAPKPLTSSTPTADKHLRSIHSISIKTVRDCQFSSSLSWFSLFFCCWFFFKSQTNWIEYPILFDELLSNYNYVWNESQAFSDCISS